MTQLFTITDVCLFDNDIKSISIHSGQNLFVLSCSLLSMFHLFHLYIVFSSCFSVAVIVTSLLFGIVLLAFAFSGLFCCCCLLCFPIVSPLCSFSWVCPLYLLENFCLIKFEDLNVLLRFLYTWRSWNFMGIIRAALLWFSNLSLMFPIFASLPCTFKSVCTQTFLLL